MSVPKEDLPGSYATSGLMEIGDTEPKIILQNIKEVIQELMFCHVSELEDKLKTVMPILVKTMQQMYIRNDSVAHSSEDGVLEILRANFQVALSLTDYLHNILQHLMKKESIPLNYIPSLPVNMAQVLYLTFDHCKNSQKTYTCYYKSVCEIFDLFKKTQELHRVYLHFLDTHLVVDFLNKNDVEIYEKILEMVAKISRTLSGVNMQSMVDNWKGFLTLVYKSSVQKVVALNLSLAVQILSEEINNFMLNTIEMEPLDEKKCSQNFKFTSFLAKVVLKLFEIDLDYSEIYEDILKFWIMIYRWNHGFFRSNKYPHYIVDTIFSLFELCSKSVGNFISQNSGFLKFCIMDHNFPVSNQNFGFLMFVNTLIKELPKILKNEPTMFTEFHVASILELVFKLTQMCYKDYFCDYNSDFYEQLVTNVSLVVLIFPNQFPEAEFLLLKFVVKDNIWTALLAIDIWCLVLRYSHENVCRSTFNALIKKIDELKLGLFHHSPAMVRLKILTQRIFKTLSSTTKNEEMTKYNPTTHLFAWKILNLRNIPLSHRYYVEFLMSDILEKTDIMERDNCSSSDVLLLLESLDIMSYTKFNDLDMTASRLVPFIIQLWSFDIRDISLDNNIFKYFVYKLIKITTTVSGELTTENLILILNQFKSLSNDVLFELLICDMLQIIAKRDFNNFPEKHTLFILILSLFQNLLADKNAVVVQSSLESFLKISDSNNYDTVVHKLSVNSPHTKKVIASYIQRKAAEIKYNLNYFDGLQSFTYHHRCHNSTNANEHICKKIKIDDDPTVMITKLKEDAEKLLNITDKNSLSTRQKWDIKYVIRNLETLLN